MGCLKLTYREEPPTLRVVKSIFFSEEKSSAGVYRYGFGSMERDDEIKGSGNSYNFGARMYDSRLGRWLSVDPLFDKYPSLSSYSYVANIPMIYVDIDGEKIRGVKYNSATGQYKFSKSALKRGTDRYIKARTMTASGREAVQTLLNDKKRYKISVTDDIVVQSYPTDDGGKNYAVLKGLTMPGKFMVFMTNTTSTGELKGNGDSDDLIEVNVINNSGDVVSKKVKRSQINNVYSSTTSAYAKTYARARSLSGFKEYINQEKNKYTSNNESIHNTGAHEETHLREVRNLDLFSSEFDAFSKEKEAAEEFNFIESLPPTTEPPSGSEMDDQPIIEKNE